MDKQINKLTPEELKAVQDEIKKLKNEKEEVAIQQGVINNIVDDNKELIEKNEKLKKQLEEKEKEVSLINSEEMENEEEIAKLKEENKKLNFQVDALDKQATDFCLQKGKLKEENKVLLDTNVPIKILNENRELKEENERLDKKVGELQKIRETDIDFNLHNAHVNLLKGEIEELKEGIEELKEEIDDIYKKLREAEGIKEFMTDRDGIAEAVYDYVQGFHEKDDEIEKLKEEACDYEGMRKHRDTLLEESEELKEEIEKLKEENKKLKDDCVKSALIMKEFERFINKEKEENKKLKKELHYFISVFDGNTSMKKLKEENEKLREEIETLQYQYDMAIQIDNKEISELKEHLECEKDGYPTSDWFKEKLDFHIKYHFTNEGGEYYENMKDLKEKPNCLDDLIYGSLERIREENEKLREEIEELNKRCKFCNDFCPPKWCAKKMLEENEKLKERVDIMEKCKKLWYEKCQEDPDDDPDKKGIKWSICLEGALNHFSKAMNHYEKMWIEEKEEKEKLSSDNHNMMCVLNSRGITNKKEYDEILNQLNTECEPDLWDRM